MLRKLILPPGNATPRAIASRVLTSHLQPGPLSLVVPALSRRRVFLSHPLLADILFPSTSSNLDTSLHLSLSLRRTGIPSTTQSGHLPLLSSNTPPNILPAWHLSNQITPTHSFPLSSLLESLDLSIIQTINP